MSRGRRIIDPEDIEKYTVLRTEGGWSRSAAAQCVGVADSTARRWDEKYGISTSMLPHLRAAGFKPPPAKRVQRVTIPDTAQKFIEESAGNRSSAPFAYEELCPEAIRALGDIVYFAERYFGVILMPFQVEAADKTVELLETPEDEYMVVNAPPGSGKTTFFPLILAAWLTCRDRTVRGMIGSASHSLAKLYTNRLRVALTRATPVKAKPREKKLGLAVDAVATLTNDFGRFKPDDPDNRIWRADGFIVAQVDDLELSDKELTWVAIGWDSKYIGQRFDICIWDDAHDRKAMRTVEGREKMQEDWTDVAEQRLEPGGLLILQGQRLGGGDLYSYALSKRTVDEEDDIAEDRPVYHHLKYRAHYEDRCKGEHGLDAKPYPQGCLLYPRRITWRKCTRLQQTDPSNYMVVMQQENADPGTTLVQKIWVSGGRDPNNGREYPGCWDDERGLGMIPAGLSAPFYSIATCDPSPAKFWAIEWWVYHPESQFRFLLDVERRKMGANKLIDWDEPTKSFEGIMEDWHHRSIAAGAKIGTWIFEKNAAQRFVLQFKHVHRWMAAREVNIVSHETTSNKADPNYGVMTIGKPWENGLVRLPGRQDSRYIALRLVDEVTSYPTGTYDDCVMAQWFLEWNLPRLITPSVDHSRYDRPGFAPDRCKPRIKVVA